jgi:hypothetical protein
VAEKTETETPAASTALAEPEVMPRANGIERSTRRSPFAPLTKKEAWWMAQTLAGSDLVPKDVKGKPADVYMILMQGNELGLSAAQSFRALFVINGRIGMYAAFKVALVRSRPDVCKYFRVIESTAQSCTCETVRADDPEHTRRHTFTMADAERAGLVSRNANYKVWPAKMLLARCQGDLVDMTYQELTFGLNTREDLEDFAAYEHEERPVFMAPPAPAPVAARGTTPAVEVPRNDPKEEAGSFAAEPGDEPCRDPWHDQAPGTGARVCPTCALEDTDVPAKENENRAVPLSDDEAIAAYKRIIEKATDKKAVDEIGKELAANYPDGGVVRKAVGPIWAAKMAGFRRGRGG